MSNRNIFRNTLLQNNPQSQYVIDIIISYLPIPENVDNYFEECWEWMGSLTDSGYGIIKGFHKQTGKDLRISREMFKLYYGIDPTGFEVCHECDNPYCCNPEHCFLGTHADNMRDMSLKGRAARGDNSGVRILCQREVIEILQRIDNDEFQSVYEIAVFYNCSVNIIRKILDGLTWVHVTSSFPISLSVLRSKIVRKLKYLKREEVIALLDAAASGNYSSARQIYLNHNCSKSVFYSILNHQFYTEITDSYPISLDDLKRRLNMNGQHASVLDEQIVLEIRDKLKNNWSLSDIAREYDISVTAVSRIRDRKTWKNI